MRQDLPKIGLALGVGLLLTLGIGVVKRVANPSLPVVLIVVDGLRADALSDSAGAARTPHMDSLSEDGVAFTRAFAHHSESAPALAALLASRLPHETAVRSAPTLAEHMRGTGVRTLACMARSDLTGARLDRGFDRFESGSADYTPAQHVVATMPDVLDEVSTEPFLLMVHLSDPGEPYGETEATATARLLLDGREVADNIPTDGSLWRTDLTLGPGRHELEIVSDGGAFALQDLHCTVPDGALHPEPIESAPGQTTDRLVVSVDQRSRRAAAALCELRLEGRRTTRQVRDLYRQEIEDVDRAIGDLVGQLERRGLYEDSLIVLTGLRGEPLGERPDLDRGENLHDEVLRVPLIVKLPEGHGARKLLEANRLEVARHVDLAPTVLDILGMTPMNDVRGTSLIRAEDRIVRAEAGPSMAPSILVARDERYKLVFHPREDTFAFYNLDQDPSELDDVFSYQGHLREDWQASLRSLAERLGGIGGP